MWSHFCVSIISRIEHRIHVCVRSLSTHILDVYQTEIRSKRLRYDAHQVSIIKHLDALDEALHSYSPQSHGGASRFARRSARRLLNRLLKCDSDNRKSSGTFSWITPQGVYLHGDVGCGKTMLMDLFADNCCVDRGAKRRVHFHAFMHEIHDRLHQFKSAQNRISTTTFDAIDWRDPIPSVAREIATESWLLCIDEMQVTDIGDAMIIRAFFHELFNNGVILVTTSNRAPDQLYKHGLQRSQFLPFIPLLKAHCKVLQLNSGIDYRRLMTPESGGDNGNGHWKTYFVVGDDKAAEVDHKLDTIFKILAKKQTDSLRPRTLYMKGRNVAFAKARGNILDSTFAELCDRALGAADYLEITQAFRTIFVRNIPQLSVTQDDALRSQARRFITMIDTFYDNRVRLIISAAVTRDRLFNRATENEDTDQKSLTDDQRRLMDDLGLRTADATIFSGEEESFAFYRTLSRLAEMQSKNYWDSCK